MKTLLKRVIYGLLPAPVIDWLKVRRFYFIFDKYVTSDFPERPMFEKLLRPGDSAVDVGANIGLITKVLMTIVGPTGMVHSIEPVPYTFKVLTSNIERSGARNVICYDVAISDRDGEATLAVPTYGEIPVVRYDSSGSLGGVRNYHLAHLTMESPSSADRPATRHIATRSLDSLLGDRRMRIGLIKCSAVGFELQCMLGAERILSRERPALFIDPCSDPDEPGTPMFQLTAYLCGFGYAPYLAKAGRLQPKTERLTPGADGLFTQNLFFLTKGQVASAIDV